ncbi:MAG: serine/threonine protein kinase [Myxococcales bacterium]|nr:serine/threonine protein kinase [Myxococcales bacterium]
MHDSAMLVEEQDLARLGTAVGNYRLDRILGRGGMGTVYSGEHVYIKKPVAVKVLHPQFARYPDAVNRFLREARAASSINHPNIVDVTDFGVLGDGLVYFVMEYLEGKSLEDLIEKDGAVELHRALNVVNQMSYALEAAHELGVIHRDLKPDNIMLLEKPGRRDIVRMVTTGPGGWVTERERSYDFVKILDFGIAKILAPDELGTDTLQGAVFGTPEYMSPEAARGEDVDLRTDIYSLGVILFDMLCGRPPYEAEAGSEVLHKHINAPVPSPREFAPHREITEGAERVVMKAMAKDPARRYQTMAEFRGDLPQAYGTVSYRRHKPVDGEARGPDARKKRLTEEIDDWLRSDQSSMSVEEARMLALVDQAEQAFGATKLSPQDAERMAKALDDALDDD